MIKGLQRLYVGAVLGACAVCLPACVPEATPEPDSGAAVAASDGIPSFEPDAGWLSPLPNGWILASAIGLFAEDNGHVWLSHRAELVPPEAVAPLDECCVRAPLVMEYDERGEIVQWWGAHDEAEDWPTVLHGLRVDHNGYVWSNARDHHEIRKLTRDGEVVLTIGKYDETGGSHDTERLGRPADIHIDAETNELFVVDGYINRRVIVFDAETGAYLRHWGAYGEPPDDEYEPEPMGPDSPPSRQFNLVHGITGSDDGLIYVADQQNSRVQVFQRDGEFVMERVIRSGEGAATAIAVSHDPEQRFVYVADGAEHKIWILRRDGLEVVGEFGSPGAEPGQFGRPHNIAVDSDGNVYVAEAHPGRRAQKFNFQGFGMGAP